MVLPRGRRLLGLVLVALACASGGGFLAYGPRRAARVAKALYRVSKGKATDLRALGQNGAGIGLVERILERKLEEKDLETKRDALLGLVRGFPENRFSRAVREYEALTGEPYFGNGWAKVIGSTRQRGAAMDLPLAEAIARWKALVAENPDFTGRDDAGLKLARCQEEAGDALGAFFTLLAARSWGDQDARFVIEDRIANVLDAQLSLSETLELAKGSTNALVVYSAAVKLARAHRFEEAVAHLDRFLALAAHGEVDLLGHSPSYFVWRDDGGREVVKAGEFLSDVRSQRALWTKLGKSGPLACAERLLREPHAFANLVLHESVRSDRAGVPADEQSSSRDVRFIAYCGERNHLAQAASIFESVARVDSSSRTRALLGAAVARIGLAGYWGHAHGHAVPASSKDAPVVDATSAVGAVLRASSLDEFPLVSATLIAAIVDHHRWGSSLSSRVLEEGGYFDSTPCRAVERDDTDTTFALREENARGR